MIAVHSASVKISVTGVAIHKMNGAEGRFDFPGEENKILEYWDKIDAFRTSLELTKGKPKFTFMDGPPFATGLPHYGHILAGTIKDVVTRFASMDGKHVERRFCWDCHGLPVEYEIDKMLGIKSKEDVMKMGIEAYNKECRNIVMRYSGEWEKTVRRSARWIDFKDDCKSMYLSYMESVWWVFGQLFEKGQIYRGFKVMPFSTACNTPLSNFEVALNYKDVQDVTVTVEMPLVDHEDCVLLIWTTTPWTLPSNLAVCVHPNMLYAWVRGGEEGKTFIIAESLAAEVMKKAGIPEYTVVKTCAGADLEGLSYRPAFDYFADRKAAFPLTHTVVMDAYVTSDAGTGLVHQAPAFGEDDYNVCLRYGIIREDNVPCPVDDNGCFIAPVPSPYLGLYWKDANPRLVKDLSGRKRLFHQSQIMHSYPFCWRSDTPLIYRTIPCWFVRVSDIVPDLMRASAETRWVPDFVQEKRFQNWLGGARDWAISRNRYWGTPIPVWANEDFSEVVCISSVQQLEEASGVEGIKDLHRESIDHITIPSKHEGASPLRRIEEVLDCWFESGSLPFAQHHYPFENYDCFDGEKFPVDFIAEGLDQTRGWFYTLTVIGVHLFGKVPFKNLIVNGIIQAADGKKMSKSLKNYPDPAKIFDQYGADALRLYLINSPVVRAEPLKFKEEGVYGVVKDVLNPWRHSFNFLSTQLDVYKVESGVAFEWDPKEPHSLSNTMDIWILASFQTLIKNIRIEMAQYKLYSVVPPLLSFIESLTNWYIRLNRRRLKGDEGLGEMKISLGVLFDIIYNFAIVMAPFTPLFAENLYMRLISWIKPLDPADDGDLARTKAKSVHFQSYPSVKEEYFNGDIERSCARLQQVMESVRKIRESANISLKTPLSKLVVLSTSQEFRQDLSSLSGYLVEELNVREMLLAKDQDAWGVSFKAKPNFKLLGQKLKKSLPTVQRALALTSQEDLESLMKTGKLIVEGHELDISEVAVERVVAEKDGYAISCESEFIVLLHTELTDELREEGLAREVINRVQKLRKKANLVATDVVKINCSVLSDPTSTISKLMNNQMDYLCKALKTNLNLVGDCKREKLVDEVAEIADGTIQLSLSK